MRAAVYTGTRNLYDGMLAAAKSLLIHSNVEQIYFLIEDDKFPYELPSTITTINISGQEYFPCNGPNFRNSFTYMALMRAALTKVFPHLDRILSLDVDTIINENISSLWDLDLSNYYFAACEEPGASKEKGYLYINAGVMMINLDKLRTDHKDEEVINAVNTKHYKFDIQDAYAEYCQGNILVLPADYNYNEYTDYKKATSRKIIHYAGIKKWQHYPLVDWYKNLPNIEHNVEDNYDLDIIIPSYNDIEGLERTLKSIYYPVMSWIHIYVIDDASDVDYTPILTKYPNIHLYKLTENSGPGHARKYGIQVSNSGYIMFVDCGDIILSKWCFLAIREELLNYRVLDIYEWSWINGDTSKVSGVCEPSTPGKIYKRLFLQANDIYPYDEGPGSYAAEDCGLNNSCYAIIEDYGYVEETPHIKHYSLPIYRSIPNQDSLTHKNKNEFWYTVIPGVVLNCIYCMDVCERLQINKEICLDKVNLFLSDLYKYFLMSVKKRKDLLPSHWQWLRRFYLETYSKYEAVPENDTYLMMYFSSRIKTFIKLTNKPNIKLFLRELKEYETLPKKYGGD